MGREIRMVPPNWKHPLNEHGHSKPMLKGSFETAWIEWLADFDRIRAGNMTKFESKFYTSLADWAQNHPCPQSNDYCPWNEYEATWFQVWETVSEGTPVSPPFATKEELISYLAKNGDDWDKERGKPGWGYDAAKRFVENEWAPTFIIQNNKIVAGYLAD